MLSHAYLPMELYVDVLAFITKNSETKRYILYKEINKVCIFGIFFMREEEENKCEFCGMFHLLE